MPSISNIKDRHVIVDHRPGQYLAFPDIGRTRDGTLVVAYMEADRHVATRFRLVCKKSRDQGRTWSRYYLLNRSKAHCPRVTLLDSGRTAIIDDRSKTIYLTADNARTWTTVGTRGLVHPLPDRILELGHGTWLTAAHMHRGTHPLPMTGQPPIEQMVYISENQGAKWRPLSVMAFDGRLMLCEASMTRLPDGRILALLRENSGVFEPMYACVSEDGGKTWSDPGPTPMIGHRPCLGLTRDGRLLVTYRNVAPNGSVAAWTGDLCDLDDFRVHSVATARVRTTTDEKGLRVHNPGGEDAYFLYALRPLTDPGYARATLKMDVEVHSAQDKALAVRFGVRWRIFPDRIVPDLDDAGPVRFKTPGPRKLRFEYDRGRVTLFTGGRRRIALDAPMTVRTRPVLIGSVSADEDNACDVRVSSLSLETFEPRYDRRYQWSWTPGDGPPDEYARRRVLELKNDRKAAPMDYGYSGWIETGPGEFACVYHFGGGGEPGYVKGETSRIMATRFFADDFSR